jgi:hypothetical protein
VSFDVRRGQFSLHDRKRTLAVRVPIHIDMSVCKPFAGTCVTYGRCIPRYEVTASIDKELRDGELPPLHLEQRLLQGCQIGIDVTPMITAVVEEQLVRAQSDAQGQIPRLSPLLRMATRSVDLPLEVAPELCLDVAPKKLSWLAPSLDANWLSTGASLDVALVPVDCQAELPVPKVPPLENSTKKKKPRVRLPERVSTAAIERGLAEVLAQSKGDELSVRVQSITPGKDGLLLELELQGSYCGTILLPTRTTMTEGSLSLVPFDIEETGLEPSLHGQLHRRLSAPLPLALPGRDLAGSLPGLLSALLPLLEAQIGEKISLTLPEPDRSYAQPLADGVQITHVLEGPVTVESSL